jgi:hypothetical protein
MWVKSQKTFIEPKCGALTLWMVKKPLFNSLGVLQGA